MNGKNVRNVANNLKSIGLVKNWSDFSVRYCQRSKNYLKSIRPQTNISSNVYTSIIVKLEADQKNIDPMLYSKIQEVYSIFATVP